MLCKLTLLYKVFWVSNNAQPIHFISFSADIAYPQQNLSLSPTALFFMLGHKSGLHDPFSSIFVDISVTSVIAFDPSTSKVELIVSIFWF